MNINFQIHYRAEYGQSLCVIEIQESILGWTEKSPLVLNCQGTDFWQVNVPISDFAGSIRYKYAIRVGEGQYIYEAGEPRILNLVESQKSKVERQIVVRDARQADARDAQRAHRARVADPEKAHGLGQKIHHRARAQAKKQRVARAPAHCPRDARAALEPHFLGDQARGGKADAGDGEGGKQHAHRHDELVQPDAGRADAPAGHPFDGGLRVLLDRADAFLNLARGLLRFLSEFANFVGDDREAAALFACARRLDGRIERKEVRLLRDADAVSPILQFPFPLPLCQFLHRFSSKLLPQILDSAQASGLLPLPHHSPYLHSIVCGSCSYARPPASDACRHNRNNLYMPYRLFFFFD